MEILAIVAIILLVLSVGVYLGVITTVSLTMMELMKTIRKKFWEDR